MMKDSEATLPAFVAGGPFHQGERIAQEWAGVVSLANAGARGIREYMPDQHRAFFSTLPFMVLGGVDSSGQPWATIRAGRPGFISSPDEHTLSLRGGALSGDPLAEHMTASAFIGGIGIQPHTRRRNRVNGVISQSDEDGLTIAVRQSFGNCPKYITTREAIFTQRPALPARITHADALTDADRRLISTADTFFVASVNLDGAAGRGRGADVSHRGGAPGFVQIANDGTLLVPDYVGNNFFNTIGNLLSEPRAGLLFIDFETSDVLYLAARTHVVWDVPLQEPGSASDAAFASATASASSTSATRRLIRFHVEQVRRVSGALPLRWKPVEGTATQSAAPVAAVTPVVAAAPVTPVIATTPVDAASRNEAARRWRTLRITKVVDESPSVRSFHLQPTDGKPLDAFKPGQFLPVRSVLPGSSAAVVRNYTLSSAKEAVAPSTYRISVKRSGTFSQWLHDVASVDSTVEALSPRGTFTLDETSVRPVVLAAAGIGITPMMAMLDGLRRVDADRKVHLFYGTHRFGDSAFSETLLQVAATDSNLSLYYFESALERDLPGVRRFAGHLDSDAMRRLLPFDSYDFYLCGPQAFMQGLHAGLRALDVAEDRIFSEAFGPSGLKRPAAIAPQQTTTDDNALLERIDSIPVTFGRAGRSVSWSPQDENLLGTVARCDLDVPSSCLAGICGTCSTRVLAGAVEYDAPPDADIDAGHALLCVARPSPLGVTLDL